MKYGNYTNETITNEIQNTVDTNTTQNNEVLENPNEQNIIEEPRENKVDENQTSQDKNEITEGNTTESGNIIDDTSTEGERRYLVISPEKMAKDLDGIVTKDGVQTEEAGTGYKIIIDGNEYIIVKRGDANGDGYVKSNDYLIIKDYIIGNKGIELKDEYLQAADVTNDKAVKANDYLKIKDHIMYGVDI